jgi:hypothetical protein
VQHSSGIEGDKSTIHVSRILADHRPETRAVTGGGAEMCLGTVKLGFADPCSNSRLLTLYNLDVSQQTTFSFLFNAL